MRETTLTDLKREIKRQYREKKKGKRTDYNFLGYVENKDLTREVENIFKAVTPTGYTYYNWVDGSEGMKDLIKTVEEGVKK